jgi:hypothetical protein
MHTHGCLAEEHFFECDEDCECICGLPMNGNDHSDCPVELRPCPAHKAEWERGLGEAMSCEKQTESKQIAIPLRNCECGCGCSEVDAAEVVGWCFHCTHVYANYSPEIQDQHLAGDCPGAPSDLKQAVLASLGRRQIQ